MFKDIEQAYLHDFKYSNIQSWLKDNHNNIFYSNKIQKENPFICGVVYGIIDALINSNIYMESTYDWLYTYAENNKTKIITCVDDSAIKWAKDFAHKSNKYLSINCNKFIDGEALFLDFFHGEYMYSLKEETKLFQHVDDVVPTFDINLNNKVAIFLD